MTTLSAGIIAAGEGSRLKQGGVLYPKPLVPVAGVPLIGHTLNHFAAAGIRRAVIIFNEETGQECMDWVKGRFPGIQFEFIVKSTESSFASFRLVGQKLGPGRHLMSTVDALCSADDVKKMVRVSESHAQAPSGTEPLLLGLTSFVDDEKPLWVRCDAATGRLTELGGSSGNFVTAGYYGVHDSIFRAEPEGPIASLRQFLKGLVQGGVPVYGVPLAKVVDVDHPRDMLVAEAFLKQADPKA